MTTFSDFASRASGVGVNWILSIGPPASAAVYVYGMVGTTNISGVDPRIVNMTSLNRGFPADYGMQASEITVTLDNTDGEASWLLAVAGNLSSFNSYNYTLSCEMYDVETPTDYATKTLGVFELLDWPVRGEGAITIQLVDHARGRGAALAEAPSVADWCAVTDAARPAWLTTELLNGAAEEVHPNLGTTNNVLSRDFDFSAPLPLWFGTSARTPIYVGGDVYVCCAVYGEAGALPLDEMDVWVGDTKRLPSTLPTLFSSAFGTTTFWEFHRSATITKSGRDWHIIWLTLDLSGYADTARTDPTDIAVHQAGVKRALEGTLRDRSDGQNKVSPDDVQAILETPPVDAFAWALHEANASNIRVFGLLWSHPIDDGTYSGPPGVTIIEDLFEYYAEEPQAIDGASFDAVRALRYLRCSGALASGNFQSRAYTPNRADATDGDMSPAIRSICSLLGFDVFFAWDGTITASMMAFDLASITTTPTALDETTFVSISDRVHGAGERHRPYNRAYFRDAGGYRHGPLDSRLNSGPLRQIIEREFDGSWIGDIGYGLLEWQLRQAFDYLAGGVVRPVVTVRTGLNGLNLELGDYVSLTWTDFVGHPTIGDLDTPFLNYSGVAFRVEGIRVDPLACMTELELVYVERMFDGTTRPYILDNETTSTRATGSGGRTATLTNASTTVTFSSGNLTTDGVVAGDQLIVLDATEATASFSRNRVLEIVSVDTATTCTVGESNFGSGGPFVLSTWEIRRSYLTFRANAENYGKTCESDSEYSDDTAANKLLDG